MPKKSALPDSFGFDPVASCYHFLINLSPTRAYIEISEHFIWSEALGSPPPLWRILNLATAWYDWYWFTPTSVEDTWSITPCGDALLVHPHLCGGYYLGTFQNILNLVGSPPPLWRIPFQDATNPIYFTIAHRKNHKNHTLFIVGNLMGRVQKIEQNQ